MARIQKRTAYLTVRSMKETACAYYETWNDEGPTESIWLHEHGAELSLRRCRGWARVKWLPLNGEIRLIGPGHRRIRVYSCGGSSLVDRQGTIYFRSLPPRMPAPPSGHTGAITNKEAPHDAQASDDPG